MVLRLFNTLTKRKDPFVPIDPAHVRMYVCGPTVYDFAHIGNARPVIVFDLLFRVLREIYGEDHVKYVRNITDVDDKINARARRDFPNLPVNEAIRRVTEATERQFHEDIAALGVLTPARTNRPGAPVVMVEPRATEHMTEMGRLIDRLVEEGHAYVAEDHVLFDVPSMPDYGALSRKPLGELETGARVEVESYKRSPLDFVLWKPSKPDEPSWPSPAGIAAPGRPGWHIECSAMAWRHLGEGFDIHGGGLDLIFPHHENEIAQSRCCFGTPAMANVWMHNEFLQVEGEKMSKSLGNFLTIGDVLNDWPGEVIRFNMLKTHYRQPIDWTVRSLQDAEKSLERLWRSCWEAAPSPSLPDEFLEPLANDLNFHQAEVGLHGLRSDGRSSDLRACLDWLGFPAWNFRTATVEIGAGMSVEAVHTTVISEAAAGLINRRVAARAAKDWAESDRIRDELTAMGVQVKDNKDGTTTWSIARP